MIAIEK